MLWRGTAAHQRLSLAKSMSPRLGFGASSRIYSLPPDLIEMVSHVLLREGWCPGGGLVRRTIALLVEAENRANAFDVARSRAAVSRTIAAAAQSKADADAAELARCEDAATLAAANAAQCTVMATSALQLLEQARQPALKLAEATAAAKRLKIEAFASTKACGDLAARSITAESPSIEANVQTAVEQAASAQTAAATAEAHATALAEEARIAEPHLRKAEHTAHLAVADAASASDLLVASKQQLQEMRQSMVQAMEAQALAASAEVAAIEAERSLQVCTAGAAAAKQAEIVERVAIRSRALRKENRAVLAMAERDIESAGWIGPIDDEQGMYYYNARTERRTRAQPQALREVFKIKESVLQRQKANLQQILAEIGLQKLDHVPDNDDCGPDELQERTNTSSSEEVEDSPPGTPPSESKQESSPPSCSALSPTKEVWVGGFSGVLWDGPLPPLFVRHSVNQKQHGDDCADKPPHCQLGAQISSSSSASSLYSMSSSASSTSSSSNRRAGQASQLASKLETALVRNEQLAVAAAAARAKSAQLLTPSVLGQRMEWLECLKQGRLPHRGSNSSSDHFSTLSGTVDESAGRRSSRHSSPTVLNSHTCREMIALDLCRVD